MEIAGNEEEEASVEVERAADEGVFGSDWDDVNCAKEECGSTHARKRMVEDKCTGDR